MSNKKTRNIDKRIRKAQENEKQALQEKQDKIKIYLDLYVNQRIITQSKEYEINRLLRKKQEISDILLKFANLKKMKNTGKLFKELFEVLESY
jgi:hypothetical protein